MKIFSILKTASAINQHPQEDFFAISKKYSIFVVADGVSLNFDDNNDYPKHSGSGEVAKIFCETVINEAEKRYENFRETDLKEIFGFGNKAVFKYNLSQGRTKETINYFDFDLFSATTSFLLIKNNKAFWWSLCDSGVLLCDKNGAKKFQSPNGWMHFPKNWIEEQHDKDKIITRHRDYRNAVVNNKLIGYGAVNGEEAAKSYLNTGVLNVNEGDLIFVYTDGFENYFGFEEFINLFKLWPNNLENQLEDIIFKKSKAEPGKYGREKVLITISI